MNGQSIHKMVVKNEFDDGSQEWFCPICLRHFILHWPPNYHRQMLFEGDELAIHNGGTGGLVIEDVEIESNDREAPFRDFMEKFERGDAQ